MSIWMALCLQVIFTRYATCELSWNYQKIKPTNLLHLFPSCPLTLQSSEVICLWFFQRIQQPETLKGILNHSVTVVFKFRLPKVDGFLGTSAKLWKANISFVMCLHLSAWENSAPTTWIFMKFHTLRFFENPSRKFKFDYSPTRITGTLHADIM